MNILKMKLLVTISTLLLFMKSTNGIPVNNELVKSSQWMNEAADPCNDFLNFTCGGFTSSNEIPEGQIKISIFQGPSEEFNRRVKSMLEEPIEDGDFKPLNNVKMYYKSCTNTQRIKSSGLNDLRQLVVKLGGWPVVDPNWNEEEYDWTKIHYKMTDIGLNVDAFIDVDVGIDYEDKTVHRIKINRMSYGSPDNILRKGKEDLNVQEYLTYMTEIAVLFGAGKTAENDMEDVLNLEIKLAQNSLLTEDLGNATLVNNKFTIAQLQSEFPNVPWLEYLTKILMNTVVLDTTEIVMVREPKYIKVVDAILAETPKRVLANFQIWHAVLQMMFTTGKEAMNKKNTNRSMPLECIEYLKEFMPVLLGSMYVRKYADPQSRSIADQMADLIIAEFKGSLDRNDWMDKGTKSVASKKAKALKKLISYSDDLLDDNFITQEFKHLHLDEDNFLNLTINISRFYNYLEYSELRKPVDNSEWFEYQHAADVTATYDPPRNSLVCAAGLLHHDYNFFDKSQPMYMNFGRLGSKLAQGLTKDFYVAGRHFDIEGEFDEWWSNETEQAFKAKAKCIVDQFSIFAKNNGLEEFSDKFDYEDYISSALAGNQYAYRAYKKWLTQYTIEEYRPNLSYSNEQFFWINAGQMFCFKSSNPLVNTLFKFNILGTFGNLEEFSKDWHCPMGSKMNPITKCSVW